jgi:hypothetical protein
MLIKVLVSMSGPSETYTGGQVYEVADERAARMIARGFAVSAEETAAVVETTELPPIVEPTAEPVSEPVVAPAPISPKRGRRK